MSDDEDDFAFYGTAVEQLDGDNFTTKKAPRLEDQTATDKQGRRRFHGAFTGGFSAGHFNTVGSMEGFTPSSFTSSRSERNKEKLAQNVEMFMDEEDLSAHGIAAQRLQPAAEFGGGGSKRKRVMPSAGPIPGVPVLLDLTVNTSESVGVRLLRRLGWREGQGVGPRLSHKQKRKASKQTLTGHVSDSDSELPAQYSDVTFAPDDCGAPCLASEERKDNIFGLGYQPLSRDGVLGSRSRHQATPFAVTEKKKTMTIKGQAFGVGAFEEEDEDIYTTEDMSDYNFTLGGAAPPPKDDNNGRPAKAVAPTVGAVCELLEGFVLSTAPLQPIAGPTLPRLPPDYVPMHRPLRKRFSSSAPQQRGLGRHDIGPDDRRRMRDAPAASVEVRTGVKGQEPPPPPPAPALPPLPPELFTDERPSGPGYQPFASDADKQRRYELYLRMKEKGLAGRYSEVQAAALTEWEREREVREFERAAQLYKPLTTAMATRFVSSTVGDSTPLLKDGLNMSIKRVNPALGATKEPASGSNSGNAGPSAAPSSDPRMQAAQASMFGRLTLSVLRWHPDTLLCRRFNVPSPYPQSRRVGVVSDTSGGGRHDAFEQPPPLASCPPDAGARAELPSQGLSAGGADEAPTRVMAEETPEMYGLKVPVTGPLTMDLFKAIFEGSSSSSSSSSDSSDSDADEGGGSGAGHQAGPPQEPQKDEPPPSRRPRKSRFEPRQEDLHPQAGSETDNPNSQSTSATEVAASELPKHVFISQKNKPEREKTANGVGKHSSKNKKKSSSVVKSNLSFMVESDGSDEETAKRLSKRGNEAKSSSPPTFQKNANYQSPSKDNSETDKNLNVSQALSSTFPSSSDPSYDVKSPTIVGDISSCTSRKSEAGFTEGNPSSSDVRSEPAVPISELPKPTKLSQSRATGIFADIDFTELNKYRELIAEPSKEAADASEAPDTPVLRPVMSIAKTSASETVRKVLGSESEASDDSSLDSDEAYGAALPPNFVNPLQVIQGRRTAPVGDGQKSGDARLVEKSKKSHDSRHKTKKKKSEKKKKHKKKSHKDSKKTSKEKKKKRERDDSSSSSSDY